ncbi:hypothetical protein AB4Y45_32390 [Paraburkholderia sp. EG287A]|uniref:hypothetical protein n=1 Tax=Paraburkholderia sp. EG287A TaxID=3237012 RepID=UPI0034D25814
MTNHTKLHWQNKLELAVKNCADHLRQNAGELKARGHVQAAAAAISMADLTDTTLSALADNPHSALKMLLVVADLHALQQGNGLGDVIIWPAYRRAGLHSTCETWTALTNIVREVRATLMDAVLI